MLAAVFFNHIDLSKLGRSTFGRDSQQENCSPRLSVRQGENEPDSIVSSAKGKKKSSVASTRPTFQPPTNSQTGASTEAPQGLPVAGLDEIRFNSQVLGHNRVSTDQPASTPVKSELKAPAPLANATAEEVLETLPVNDQKKAAAILKGYVSQQEDRDGTSSFDKLLKIADKRNDDALIDLLLSIRSHVLKQPFANNTEVLDSMMTTAAKNANVALLTKLLDAHPHAHRNLLDRTFGTLAFNFFRKIGSWFGSDAVAWQREQGINLVHAAAGTANTATMTLLLGRAMDLVEYGRKMEFPLDLAMASANAESTAVLLKAVLHENPGYASSMIPATLAAKKGHAGVLEVLVSNGMALPPDIYWPNYAQPVEDYLRLKAAEKQTAKGAPLLSRITRNALDDGRSSLTQELRDSLNGTHGKLTKAQEAFLQAGIIPDSGLLMVTVEPFVKQGFTAETAASLVAQLNSNAKDYFTEHRQPPLRNLGEKVCKVVDCFTAEAQVGEKLRDDLMDHGMYGLVADLVGDAIDSAAKSAIWTSGEDGRKSLLEEKLLEILAGRQEAFQKASAASGNPASFNALLNSQLLML